MKKIIKTVAISLYVFAFLLFFSGAVNASNTKNIKDIEYPGSWSRFISSDGNTRYTVECSEFKDGSGNIRCVFTKIVIGKKDSEANRLKETFAQIKKDNKALNDALLDIKKNCIKFQKNDKKLSKIEKINSLNTLCNNLTRDNLLKFINKQIIQEEETCTVYEKNYISEFKYNAETETWISQEKPYGPCGAVAIESLAKDPRKGFNSFAWSYTLKQVITNKNRKLMMGLNCSEFHDEEETGYSIGSFLYEDNKFMNCKYIDLSALI